MKKSLVLAMALTLGVAGTAFAANPFSDVPSDHWSYASVAKLAQAGVIQGYGDDTFRGDRTLTRYEMAEMVAKAMTKQDQLNAANKAMLEKLAAEYAAELNNLGVRVSKLEKNADNVKINGEMRARYQDYGKDNKSSAAQLRTRLWVTGEVNDNWKAIAMLENIANMNANYPGGEGTEDSSTINMQRAYVEGTFGDFMVTAGRYDYTTLKGMVMDDLVNGIRLAYGNDKFKVGAQYGRITVSDLSAFASGLVRDIDGTFVRAGHGDRDVYSIDATYNYKKLEVFGQYAHVKSEKTGIYDDNLKSNIAELGLGYTFDKNFNMFAEYIHGSKVNELATKTNGWAARLNYGTFSKAKQGTYNIYAQYFDVPAGADLSGHADFGFVGQTFAERPGEEYLGFGTKGWEVGVDYAAQKNLRLHLSYGQGKTNANHNASKKDQIYTSATFFF